MPGCQMGWSQKSEMQSGGAINKQVNKGHKSQSAVSTNKESHTFVTAYSGCSDPIENICKGMRSAFIKTWNFGHLQTFQYQHSLQTCLLLNFGHTTTKGVLIHQAFNKNGTNGSGPFRLKEKVKVFKYHKFSWIEDKS